MTAATYRAAVIGATGAVGSALVRELLSSSRCANVVTLGRRELDMKDAKLTQHVVDLETLSDQADKIRGCEVAFCTLGVGQASKVTKEELRRVDVGYASAFAATCKAAGVRHLSLLSAVGANASSSMNYFKVKGDAEKALQDSGVARVSFFRPSVLATKQLRYGVTDFFAQRVYPAVSWAFPRKYHQIKVEDLARAMRLNAERESAAAGAVEILHYRDFVALLRSAA